LLYYLKKEGDIITKCVNRGICLIFIFILVLTSAFPQDQEEDEEESLPLSAGLEAAVYSKYIWRGMQLNPEAVFQPQVGLSLLGFEVSVWGNLELTDSLDNKGKFTEIDYSASYTHKIGPVSASLLYIYYDYPNTDIEKTQEVGFILEGGNPLSLEFYFYYDFDEAKGFYLKPSLSYDLDFKGIILTPSIGLGWASEKYNEYNFGPRVNSLVDTEVFLRAEVELGGGFYLSMLGSYYQLIGSKLRTEVDRGKEGFWGGGSIVFAF